MSDTPAAGDPVVPPDPIYQKSYSVPIALASVALVGAVALAIADEAWLRRPYKAIQHEYKAATLVYLDRVHGEKISFERALRLSDEFKRLDDDVVAAAAATDAARIAAKNTFTQMSARATALSEALRVQRSEMSALTYDIEHAAHGAGDREALTSEAAKPLIARLKAVEAGKVEFTWQRTTLSAGTERTATGEAVDTVTVETVTESGTVGELVPVFIALQEAKGLAQLEVGKAVAPYTEAVQRRDRWLSENLKSFKSLFETKRSTITWSDGSETTEDPEALRARVAARVAEVGLRRYLDEFATMVPPAVVEKVRDDLSKLPTDPVLGGEIQKFQIHLKDTNNWVDRCEVCHLGVRSVIPVNTDDLRTAVSDAGWPNSRIEKANLSLFASHPRAVELFAKHDPDKMGCSTCHNGNGIAITSTHLAHGENHHWDWPLHPKENLEAGCLQCHQKDVHLEGGPRISKARETFMDKGCWGCHPYEGYDAPTSMITKTEGRIGELGRAKEEKARRVQSLADLYLSVPDENPRNAAVFAEKEAQTAKLVEEMAALDTEIQVARRRLRGLYDEREKVGPNLKELRVAMRPEVITPWIQDPTHVRPDTKMPVFRWWGAVDADGLNEEAKDVAAFLWQAALDPAKFTKLNLASPRGGSAGRGKQLFESETVGCIACHGVNDKDGKLVGSDFAANLSIVGEKKTYEWIYRWIKDPRHRLVPYSVKDHRDLTAEEAAQADQDTLVWSMPTRMPNLRLSDDDARDIATYLSTLRSDRKWPEAPWLTDPARAKRGEKLVLHSGCAGCHEIAGLERERGIGTELTKEGSKPIDRLAFAHLTTEAKRGHEPIPDWTSADGVKVFAPKEGAHEEHGWYRPRGFFMHKLAKPDLYDQGMYFPDRNLRSRMPTFRLTAQQLHDLTTFLLGSVETRIPATAQYNPDEQGQAVREGWWVIKKYNCEGCHAIEPGQVPSIQKLPWQDEATFTENAPRDRSFPPTLVGTGYRLRPEFIADFLRDPSLGGGTARPKSVRRHLAVRMPTFELTEEEIAKLVRFFGAKAKQPAVHQPPALKPLTAAERAAAKAIWDKANCIQCHVIGDGTPVTAETKAPDIAYAARRLRSEWMARWIPQPQDLMNKKTSMTNNFARERTLADGKTPDPASRWLYTGHAGVPELRGMTADHVDLMVRYVLELGGAK